jgi:hypothetical protein
MTLRAKLMVFSTALICAGTISTPAGGARTADTEVTLRVGNLSQPPLFGRVSSKEPDCVQGRNVQIIAVAPERGTLGPADNPTNAKGKWKYSSQLEGGTSFIAKVKAKTVDGVKCEAATSQVRSL